MSSGSSGVSAELLSAVVTITDCTIAVLTFLVYDWLLCLQAESLLVWKRRNLLSCASLVYFFSRYITIANYIVTVRSIYPMSDLSCRAGFWIQTIARFFGELAPGIFSAVRIYALSSRNVPLTGLALLLSLVPCVAELLQAAKYNILENLPSPFNCTTINTLPPELDYRLVMISRGCILAAETLVVIVTWWNTFHFHKVQREAQLRGPSLGSVFLYNGSMYFIVLAALNALKMILTKLEVDNASQVGSYLNIFIVPISAVLICHFLLNLRQVDRDLARSANASSEDSETVLAFTDPHFAVHSSGTLPPFVASLGEPVHVGASMGSRSDDFELGLKDRTKEGR